MINIKLNDEKRRYDIIANKEFYDADLLDALFKEFNTYPIPKTWIEAKCRVNKVLGADKMNSDFFVDLTDVTFGFKDSVISIFVNV